MVYFTTLFVHRFLLLGLRRDKIAFFLDIIPGLALVVRAREGTHNFSNYTSEKLVNKLLIF
jgi:hypothetical protein